MYMYEACFNYQPALIAIALFFLTIAYLISHSLLSKEFKTIKLRMLHELEFFLL